jgi:hypothetical protein
MVAVRVVQVPIHNIVGVVAVGDGVVAAVGAVVMPGRVTAAVVGGRADGRVDLTDLEKMLLDARRSRVVQVAVVQIVDVPGVADGAMAALRAVLVIVRRMMAHGFLPR